MAFYKQDIVDINLNTGNIYRSFLNHAIGYKNNNADQFGVRVFRDGVPVDLAGASCQAVFMAPNGSHIALTSYGTVSGNVAYVTLPPACYDYEGQFCLSIQLVGGGVTGTMRIVDGMVVNTGASGTVAPTGTVPTYQEILSLYDDMVEATKIANISSVAHGLDNSMTDHTLWEDECYYEGTTGAKIINEDYHETDYIEITPGVVYAKQNCGGVFVNYFDESKTRLGGFNNYGTDAYIVITDQDAKYARFGMTYTAKNILDTKLTIKDDTLDILLDTDWDMGHWMNEYGQIDGNASWKLSDYIEISPYCTYAAKHCGNVFVNYFDSGKNWISGEVLTLGDGIVHIQFQVSTAKYIRVSTMKGDRKMLFVGQKIIYGEYAYDYLTPDTGGKTVHVGTGQAYTALRAGIAEAMKRANSTVIVHPGTYDLTEEFESDISSSMSSVGILIGNGITVKFMDGAKVTAVFDNSESTYDATTWRKIYDEFQPFYTDGTDCTLENLDIVAANTRYCVHDECGGYGTYTHRFINCRMDYSHDHTDANYIQCIGGGLGQHGTIIIDGGYYASHNNNGTTNPRLEPISYHNGNNSSADSTIRISNVYIAGTGYIRFGWYGTSTIMSQVYISGCSMGLPVLLRAETSGNPDGCNFQIWESANEIREKHVKWSFDSDHYAATLVEDEDSEIMVGAVLISGNEYRLKIDEGV